MPGESQAVPRSAPDPSVMATEQMLRAVAAERDYVDGQIALLTEKITGMQRQHDDLQAQIHRRLGDLQSHLDERQDANTERFNSALDAQKEAVIKAETANEKRFESVNEFRAQLGDQATRLLSRAEADVRFTSLADKVDQAVDRAGVAIALIESRLNTLAGKEQGETGTRAGIYAAITAAVAILGAIIIVANLLASGAH